MAVSPTGSNPDLIYNKLTGEVSLDLSDIAAQYPIFGLPFSRARLELALANQDSTFKTANFNSSGLSNLGFSLSPAINSNRLSVDDQSLDGYNGQIVSLGKIFPTGIADASALNQYLAAASFATEFRQGSLDLW